MSNSFFVKGIYASGMVLQRNTVNCIYGGGANAAQVELAFRGKKSSTTADKNGEWKIEFNPGEAGGPFELKLACASDSIVFSDVYVGEDIRGKGNGTKILKVVDTIAKKMGAKCICLKVLSNSMSENWYKNNGYCYHMSDGEYNWLKKYV